MAAKKFCWTNRPFSGETDHTVRSALLRPLSGPPEGGNGPPGFTSPPDGRILEPIWKEREGSAVIRKEMSILDVLCDHPEAQEVFRGYDQVVGECVMCNHLFETLEEFTAKFGLDCEDLLARLRAAAG